MRKVHLLPSVLPAGFRVLSVRADILIRVGLTKELVEQVLRPHNAVHGFTERRKRSCKNLFKLNF